MAEAQAFIVKNHYGKILGRDGWFLSQVCFGPDRREPKTFSSNEEADAFIAKERSKYPRYRLRAEARA